MIDNENSVFRVVKVRPGVEVRAYKKFGGELGAEMAKEDFIKGLSELVGNPTMIFTKKQLFEKLMAACEHLQANMQESTIMVAGIKVPRE